MARLFELQLTDLDSKFWRSVVLLFTRPGELTRQFFDGRRRSYAKPLTLFVVLNVAFFLVQPYTGLLRYDLGEYVRMERDARGRPVALAPASDGRAAREVRREMAALGDTPAEFAVRFDAEIQQQKKSMLVFLIPLFAFALLGIRAATGAGPGQYLRHLVFSIHAFAYLLVVLLLVTPVFRGTASLLVATRPLLGDAALGAMLRTMNREATLSAVLFAAIGPYLYLALRRVYDDPRWRAAVGAVALFLVLSLLVRLYREALFGLTIAAL